MQRDDVVAETDNYRRAEKRSMTVPCIVNIWLNCSFDKNCIPGRNSSARTSSAISPPMKNRMKQVTMYISPSIL